MTHAEKMKAKQERNRTLRPGFTPVKQTGMRGVRRLVRAVGREKAVEVLS